MSEQAGDLRLVERIRAVLGDPMLDEAAMLDQVNAILDEAPLPDSETEWGYEIPGNIVCIQESEAHARQLVSNVPESRLLVRRECGPWIEVPRG